MLEFMLIVIFSKSQTRFISKALKSRQSILNSWWHFSRVSFLI